MNTNKKRILLIGGGGHCRSVLDTIIKTDEYTEIGIVDPNRVDDSRAHYAGTDEELARLIHEGWTDAFVTVGSVGDTSLRRRLYQLVKSLGFHIPALIDPSAEVSETARIEEGVFIGKKAIVNTQAFLGGSSIINSGAIIEHDCVVDEFAHVSPGAVLCGEVSVGKDSHIGAGAIIRQQIRIGEKVVIGAGSVVVSDIPDSVKAYGNPCRIKGI